MTMKLKCINCGYKFVPKTRVPDRCPYCSVVGSLRREDTAGTLLKELDKG